MVALAVERPAGTEEDPFYTIEKKYGVSGRPIFTHGPVVRRFIIGYCFLAAGTVVGLYLSYTANEKVHDERVARSAALNNYLKAQCKREANKDAVFTSVLERARASALSTGNKEYAEFVADGILKIKNEDADCVRTIPAVTPK